jgi:hypothetical protein
VSGDDKKNEPAGKPEDLARMDKARNRREALKKLGRFATVTAPTVTLLLAAQTKPSQAVPTSPCAAIDRPSGSSAPA